MRPSRREVLLAGVGSLLLGGCASDDDPRARSGRDGSVATAPSSQRRGAFRSASMAGGRVRWSLLRPPGAGDAELPLCVVLHGRGGTWGSAYDAFALTRELPRASSATAPFAVATVDGGEHSYYHPRHDGTDAGAMVVDELLPLLGEQGARTDRIALMGWSMGGYGSLRLAELLGPSRVACVAADSPALWTAPGASAPGAFDDADDFRRNDVFARREDLAGIPVRIAIGADDPFLRATRDFATDVPDLVGLHVGPGGHDRTFWRRTAARQLDFVGRRLSV